MNSIARTKVYDDMATKSIVMGASSHELIQLLFREFDSALVAAEFFCEKDDRSSMKKSLGKASRILAGLQGSLDIEKGGEIAENLSALYKFCITELFKANDTSDPKTVSSIRHLIEPISQAWTDMPDEHRR